MLVVKLLSEALKKKTLYRSIMGIQEGYQTHAQDSDTEAGPLRTSVVTGTGGLGGCVQLQGRHRTSLMNSVLYDAGLVTLFSTIWAREPPSFLPHRPNLMSWRSS